MRKSPPGKVQKSSPKNPSLTLEEISTLNYDLPNSHLYKSFLESSHFANLFPQDKLSVVRDKEVLSKIYQATCSLALIAKFAYEYYNFLTNNKSGSPSTLSSRMASIDIAYTQYVKTFSNNEIPFDNVLFPGVQTAIWIALNIGLQKKYESPQQRNRTELERLSERLEISLLPDINNDEASSVRDYWNSLNTLHPGLMGLVRVNLNYSGFENQSLKPTVQFTTSKAKYIDYE
ncbi:MAG: hypothetical protein WCJ19_02575 [bacterium]